MIIQLLLDVLYGVFATLTLPIDIPGMPDGVKEFVATTLDYIGMGFNVVGTFSDLTYLGVLFGVIVVVDVGIMVYKVVMWVLRKIPFISVE